MTQNIPFEIKRHLKWDDPEGFYTVDGPTVEDQRRWVTTYSRVVTNNVRYFDLSWEEPNTEQQEGSESDDVEVTEAWPYVYSKIGYKDTPNEV